MRDLDRRAARLAAQRGVAGHVSAVQLQAGDDPDAIVKAVSDSGRIAPGRSTMMISPALW